MHRLCVSLKLCLPGALTALALGCSEDSSARERPAPVLLAEQPAGSVEPRFAWGAPCEVRVTEEVLKKGRDVLSRYRLTLEPAEAGDGFVLHKRDYEFVSVVGMDASDPEVEAVLAPAAAAMEAVPPILVSKAGRAEGIADLRAFLEALEPEMERLGALYPSKKERLDLTVQLMRTPTSRPMIEQAASQPWQTWVEAWVDASLAPGESVTVRQRLPVPATARSVEVDFVLRNHGFVEQPPGHVMLSMTSEVSGDEVAEASRAAAQALLNELTASTRSVPNFDMLEDLRMTTRLEVVTDPATLRPASAVFERKGTLSADGVDLSRSERRKYWFDWPAESAPK